MNKKTIQDYLKSKSFKIVNIEREDVISAYNTDSELVVSWVITNRRKRPHTVIIAYKESRDIRFSGSIDNLQQFNTIVTAVDLR